MSEVVLTLGKLVLLLLLYVFLARAVRTVSMDLSAARPRRNAPPRPQTASPDRRRSRTRPAEIVVHAPEASPQVVTLNEHGLTLGRAEGANVHIDDHYVSDQHAEVSRDGDGWLVRDLGSTNGTFLNGAKITQPTPIGPGDQIRLGKTRVEVRR